MLPCGVNVLWKVVCDQKNRKCRYVLHLMVDMNLMVDMRTTAATMCRLSYGLEQVDASGWLCKSSGWHAIRRAACA